MLDGNGDSERRKLPSQFIINVVANVINIFLQVLVTIWLTRYLIGILGVAAFGVIALTGVLMGYLDILATGIFSTVSRYMTIEIRQEDFATANTTFNTAFLGQLAVTTGLVVFALAFSPYFSAVFNLPARAESDSQLLFLCVAFAFLLTMMSNLFSVSSFAYSRFVRSNAVNILALTVRISVILLLYSSFAAQMWYFGAAAIAAALITLTGQISLWRKLTPALHIHWRWFNTDRLRALFYFGVWTVVGGIGTMLLGRTDLIVVNAMFGPAATGAYATIAQLSMLFDCLSTSFVSVIRPMVLEKFAFSDMNGLRSVTSFSVKLLGIGLSLPVGILCGLAPLVLSTWLGNEFESLSRLMVIFMCHLGVNFSVRPMLDVANAMNKVKWPAIYNLGFGSMTVITSVAVAKYTGWGYEGVALVGALTWTLKNAIVIPVYTARILNAKWHCFFPDMLPGIAGTVFLSIAFYCINLPYFGWTIAQLALCAMALLLLYAIALWVTALGDAEKKWVRASFGSSLRV
jgi:O-antigen/teichoic acid export membrane protein